MRPRCLVDMKKIAVFTSHVYEQMSGMMQKGIIAAAKEYGVKLIFFASFGDSYSSRQYGEYSGYDEGDTVSFDIPDLNNFDGVIKITTYFSKITENHLEQILKDVRIPVVNIGGLDEARLNICCDDIATFSEIVEHLVVCHGCKDIYHLAGEPGQFFTENRLEAYKNVLLKHGIPYDEEKVYFGNLWFSCGEPALDYILDHCRKNGKQFPEAIACANDYSAVGLVNACKAKGIRVPEDIIITGFDAVSEAMNGFPTITTARQPLYASGYRAVETILNMLEGEKPVGNIRIKGDLILNQSCGCKEKNVDSIEDFRNTFLKRMDNTVGIAQSTTNLMLSVSNAKTLDDCFREVCKNAKTDTGFKDMLICLAPGWDKQRIVGEDFCYEDEEMTVVNGYRGDEPVPYQTFRKKDVLPKELLDDPNPYYIFTIHHLQYYMGFLIVSPDIDFREQKVLQSWFVDLGVILDNRRVQRDLEQMVARLEFLYNRDTLTEIYNRRGLEEFFGDYYDECIRNETGLAVIAIDMDDLKLINDKYGHNEGDYSLKTIAYAMMGSVDTDEICARAGGDEFTILAKNYTAEKAVQLVEKIRSFISRKVKLDDKDYDVRISVGIHVVYPDDSMEGDAHKLFEHCLKEADTALYKEKKQHKTGRNM